MRNFRHLTQDIVDGCIFGYCLHANAPFAVHKYIRLCFFMLTKPSSPSGRNYGSMISRPKNEQGFQ